MRKLLPYMLIVCLLLTLSGCKPLPPEPTQPATENVPNTEYIPQSFLTAVSVPAVTESVRAEDGTVIFNYTHQSMSLTLQDPDVADKVIIDFLGRADGMRETAENILTIAKSEYTSSAANWIPYICSILYEPTRIDAGVLSLNGTIVTFNGSAHPEQASISANYDLLTGDVLTLASILAPEVTSDGFCQLTLDALAEIAEENYLYSDYEDTVRQRFSQDSSTDEAWFFSETGICFYFSPYEIAPYASGIITVEVPYSKLTGILHDEYFPAEQDAVTGTIIGQRLQDANMDNFQSITELVLDEGGEMALLYTQSMVQDVRIDVGTWDPSGDIFTKTYTAFAADSLSVGEAIMVESLIPDTMPNLRISYQSGEQTIIVYLSQSGKDGSIILLGL